MKKLVIIISCIITILLGATLFSMAKWSVINPFSSGLGMIKILTTDTRYTVVQEYPQKVIFAKGDNAKNILDNYMEEKGFEEIKEKQMGAMYYYSNGNEEEKIQFSSNAYYSKWEWQK